MFVIKLIYNMIKKELKEKPSFKWNRYNFIRKRNDQEYVLYNCSTNNFMVMVEDVKELIINNINSVDQISSTHPQLFHSLKKKKFIVDEHFDEVKDTIKRMKKSARSSDFFELFINPTLDCNLRCWYCYETHQKNSIVSDDTLKSIMCFIQKKVESQALKEMIISFFGGEPLLKYQEIIRPIIEFTQKICEKNKKKMQVFFNTNGVLLTRKIVDQLYTTGLFCAFQVPFDGNEEYHNKTKKYPNGKGTFDKIINNVMYALSKGFKVIIRCNYTSENLFSFNELISIFTEYAEEAIKYKLLVFSYHKIWQVEQTVEMTKEVNDIEDRTNSPNQSFYVCYADRENSAAINYNGDVYNCTARDFRSENREGVLNQDGKIIYNENHQKRKEIRFSNKNCLNCDIFPICTICSQTKLEQQNKDAHCLGMFSEEEKEQLLLNKIKDGKNYQTKSRLDSRMYF